MTIYTTSHDTATPNPYTARIEELEAKLAKAVEGFEELARLGNGDRYGNSFGNLIAQKYIAELTGDKDE